MDLKDFVNGNGGISALVFEVTMEGSLFARSSKPELVDCMIENLDPEELYSLDHGYKVTLVPVNNPVVRTIFGETPKFNSRTFYQSDLMGLIREGSVKVKILDLVQ